MDDIKFTHQNIEQDLNRYIDLHPQKGGFLPYKNIVIKYKEKELTIPMDKLFQKLEELFND